MKRRTDGKHVPVIEDAEVRQGHLKVAHERYGHLGINSTFKLMLERMWWPELYRDCKNFISRCHLCQVNSHTPPTPTTIPAVPGWDKLECLAVDYLGPLPKSSVGNLYLIVAIDQATRFPWAKAVPAADAECARDFLLELFALVGAPKAILTDNGRHFKNLTLQVFLRTYRVKHYFSPAHHPETNGKVERMNGLILNGMRKLCQGTLFDWEKVLPAVLMGIRMREHETVGQTPFHLLYCVPARIGIEEEITAVPPQYVTQESTGPYSQGDIVILAIPPRQIDKLGPRHHGPYVVLEEVAYNVYNLGSMLTLEPRHLSVHASRIKKYQGPEDGSKMGEGVLSRAGPIGHVQGPDPPSWRPILSERRIR
jgi:hypothetical protein